MSTETGSILERKARIFNVQKYSIYDGPGIRTLIFFKGCPIGKNPLLLMFWNQIQRLHQEPANFLWTDE